MFIGHFAVGFAAKRYAPETSLGTLIAAAVLLDLLWPIFVLRGWEQVRIAPGDTAFTPLEFVSYPLSHSLAATIGWATLFALLYYGFRRYTRGAALVWIAVVSHWVLDFVSHRADMPLYPSGLRLGLGLWNSILATVLVEASMFAVAIWIYVRVTRAKDRIGKWGLWSFAAAVGLLYVTNIFSPPPPGVKAMVIAAIVLSWLIIFWAWWLDRHREVRTLSSKLSEIK
ncbi:MAG TPA: hypothetical protein VGW76_01800 [Pyrinomonadaceae bacterium]|nr:hypothetical protein [Pyrinomonadaceae bacterium]